MPATHVKVTARTFPLTYVVTAEQDVFTFVGVFWAKADLIVRIDGAALDPAFWTVTGDATQNGDVVVGAYGGGTIELTNAVSNCTVVIDRYVAGTRNTDFSQTAPISQNALNSDLDKLTARDQDQKANLDALSSPAWDDVTGRPTEFPPEDHTHVIADVTGLQAALDAKVDDSQVSAFGLTLVDDANAAAARATLGLGSAATAATGDFAAASHTHTASSVTDFAAAADARIEAAELGNLADVDTAGATDNQVLGYDSATDTWGPITVSGGGGGGSGDMLAANNLSDVVSASTSRTNLGVAIGSNVQAYSANLTTFAGIAPSANVQTILGGANYAAVRTSLSLVPGTDIQAYSANLTTFAGIAPSANVQSLLGAANYSAMRTLLTLVPGTDVQAFSANLSTYAGIAPSANVQTLLGAATFAAFRTSLGLGALALLGTINGGNWSGTDLAVADGGTGASTLAAHGVLIGNGTGAVAVTTTGSAGDVLTSNGASADPTFQAPTGGGGTSTIVHPQGRLTLTSNTPVMIADATAQSSVYYAPYVGKYYPWYSGSAWTMRGFTQLTMALDTTNQTSGSLYDLFVWNDGGTDKIGAGPAWTSTTARGTGAGTTELELKDGIWTNKVSITLKNGAGAGVSGVAANTATYVGTIYCTANGQTGMAFKPAAAAGGANNILGVSNAYNRVAIKAFNRDSTANWAYSTFTWRAQNNSNSNRISFVDGLQQSSILASRTQYLTPNPTASFSAIGVNLDSTSATPGVASQADTANTTGGGSATVTETFLPQLGFHFAQPVELGAGAGVTTWFGGNGVRQLNGFTLELLN